MKKIILFVCTVMFFCSSNVLANKNCFIAKENGKVLVSEGDCLTSYPPESSFKIALSLIGFDAGLLKNETDPSWGLPKGTDPYINPCKGAHNPKTWMRDSCPWYSRILTTKLGMEKFQSYITKFSYGNMDLSGGLLNAWISSSLKISPDEQTNFLQKIVDQKLAINTDAVTQTKKIMFIQEMWGGWKLYGKTGSGRQIGKNGNETELQHGWFVGFIEKDKHQIVFASHIVDNEKHETFASQRARNEALLKIWPIINNLEK